MALILSRSEGQKIYIGEDITITVRSIRGRIVLLAIDAPQDLKIIRDDIGKRERNGGNK